MITLANGITAVATADGVLINGRAFSTQLPLESYVTSLGPPTRTISVGGIAPVGHRNNHVHVFDSQGIYLTEHHASRLIDSVNFVLDSADSPFPMEAPFLGTVTVAGQAISRETTEGDLDLLFSRDLPGEYSATYDKCAISISAKGRRDAHGKRRNPRRVVRVSVSF